MNLSKLNPWNWFKHEDYPVNNDYQIPVNKAEAEAYTSVNRFNSPTRLVGNSVAGLDSLFRIHRELDHMFDDVWNEFGMRSPSRLFNQSVLPDSAQVNRSLLDGFRANLDVSGDQKQYQITLDVPSFSEADLSIEVKDNVLILKGQKEEKQENKDQQFYRIERRSGSFQRTLAIPEDGNIDDIQASLKNGVLTLSIPRKESANNQMKRINITTH